MTWPIIQCPPTPSDAKLAADRDAEHAADVAAWVGAELLWTGVTAGEVS